jgi:cytochrome c biogenesis protein CcmG, thiol:disulfide interchange protein DsbE
MITTLIATALLAQDSAPVPMPELNLRDAKGQLWLKNELKKDRVYLVEFWATWCTTCRAMHPMIKDFVKSKKDEPFTYLAVSTDEDLGALRKWLKNEKPDYPVLMDPTYEAMNRWKVKEVPSFFMIKNGEIRWQKTGTLKLQDLENAYKNAS